MKITNLKKGGKNMNELMIKIYFSAKNFIYDLTHKENGEANIIAIILVLAIVIVLAVIFRKNIAKLFNSIWSNIFSNVGGTGGTQRIDPGSADRMEGFIRALF